VETVFVVEGGDSPRSPKPGPRQGPRCETHSNRDRRHGVRGRGIPDRPEAAQLVRIEDRADDRHADDDGGIMEPDETRPFQKSDPT